jgi:Putative lumazine-binding
MKRFSLAVGLSLLLLAFSTDAQSNTASGDQSSAVSATVRDYIEGYYTGDAPRMERTLHPHYLKHIIQAISP